MLGTCFALCPLVQRMAIVQGVSNPRLWSVPLGKTAPQYARASEAIEKTAQRANLFEDITTIRRHPPLSMIVSWWWSKLLAGVSLFKTCCRNWRGQQWQAFAKQIYRYLACLSQKVSVLYISLPRTHKKPHCRDGCQNHGSPSPESSWWTSLDTWHRRLDLGLETEPEPLEALEAPEAPAGIWWKPGHLKLAKRERGDHVHQNAQLHQGQSTN